MNILDCGNIDSTYNSIQCITGLSRDDINSILNRFIPNRKTSKYSEMYASSEIFNQILNKEFRITSTVEYVMWFHASRTHNVNQYKNGLSTLPEALDGVWDFLYSLVKDDIDKKEWYEFRHKMTNKKYANHHTFLYNFKVPDSFHWGPYGFLIKDLIFFPTEIGNWDYLGSAEIAYDICITFNQYFNVDLFTKYYENTIPVIVKFRDKKYDPKYLGYAMMYLFKIFFNEQLESSCNYCYNGKSKSVSKNDIVTIEKISGWKSNLLENT